MSDNEAAPIAWVRANGEVVIVGSTGEYETVLSGIYRRGAPLPDDAVPLVPATELDELGIRYRKLQSEHDYWREQAESAPRLPALDTPEALRYAADVLATASGFCPSKASQLEWNPDDLREMAADREAAAHADAEREARIEAAADLLCQFDDLGDWSDTARAMDDLGYRLDPSQAQATS